MDSKRINVTVSGNLLKALELYKKENFVTQSTVVITIALKEFLQEELELIENQK